MSRIVLIQPFYRYSNDHYLHMYCSISLLHDFHHSGSLPDGSFIIFLFVRILIVWVVIQPLESRVLSLNFKSSLEQKENYIISLHHPCSIREKAKDLFNPFIMENTYAQLVSSYYSWDVSVIQDRTSRVQIWLLMHTICEHRYSHAGHAYINQSVATGFISHISFLFDCFYSNLCWYVSWWILHKHVNGS